MREIERLSPGRAYIQVDSYRGPAEKEIFLSWVLTAKTHHDPAGSPDQVTRTSAGVAAY